MIDYYKKERNVFAEAIRLNKAAVFEALAAAGITDVAVTFDGCGDSGQIQEMNAYISGTKVEIPKGPITIYEPSHIGDEEPLETTENTLSQVLEALCYDCLGERHSGWEIDDGSFGDFTFNVATRVIHLEYNGRFTDVFTEREEF